MKMFLIYENFLTKSQCKHVIDVYQKNQDKIFQYRDTFPIVLSKLDWNENQLIVNITNDVINLCEKLVQKKISLDEAQIVKWPKGSFQDKHYDNAGDFLASIIYLNDDYLGGKTCFMVDDVIKITPQTGKCIIFSNSNYLHWVERVQKNTRYTLAYWFI